MHPKSVLAGLLAPALILGASFAEKDSEDRNKSSSNIIQPRIVGGRYALEGEFPFVVSVQSVGLLGLFASHLCGGSLLNANTVLSAAHCFYDRSASSFRIRAGSLDKASGGILVRVSSIKIHPNYDASSSEDLATSFDYDVAILKLATSIPMSSTIDYVSVAASGSDPVASTDVTTAGWGVTKEGFGDSYRLEAVDAPLVSRGECRKAYSASSITDRMFCAGYPEGGKSPCQRDDGGPVIVQDSQGEATLLGVVSWGSGCARKDFPFVHSSLGDAALSSFITSNL